MIRLTVQLTDENYDKVRKLKNVIQNGSVCRITFSDALDNLIEAAK